MLGLSSALIASIKAGLSASHKVHCINRCVFNLRHTFFGHMAFLFSSKNE